jgi:hypothetical protein
MSKIISYSLFNSSSAQRFEKLAYIRGFYLNCRMNNLLFPNPDWVTHLEIESQLYEEYKGLFDWLKQYNNLSISVNPNNPALCEGMIWRMKPIFNIDVTHVLCRDSDALGTYREALAVQHWLESGEGCLSLHDNPAHSGLMGGMVGFDTSRFKAYTRLYSWEEMVSGFDLSQRGSDQHLLNQRIFPLVAGDVRQRTTKTLPSIYEKGFVPHVDAKLWVSNLCVSFIGSPGANELETIRFLTSNDIYMWKYKEIETQFKELFWWRQ